MAVTRPEEPLRTFHPRWPEPGRVNPALVRFYFDRLSDTLYVNFYGTPLSAVSVPVDFGDDPDGIYLRVDFESDDVVGLQIEALLIYTANHYPFLLDGLDWAELRGITREEMASLFPAHPTAPRTPATVAAFLAHVEALVKLTPDA